MRRPIAFLSIASLSVMCACSGGGSSSAPQPKTTALLGAGTPAVFNQKITFTIDVPPASATASLRRTPIHASATSPAPTATSTATTTYISPRTGSIVLTIAEVNNVSPQQAPPTIPAINVPASCEGSTSGCTIPVANVPAALGIDRYFVQTYSGADATGSLISTGFVDVSVPVKANANPSIGGTAALSIGGYVNAILLAPAAFNVIDGTASDASILVSALDAGGATIVGAAQYATPITVAVGDSVNFGFNGAASVNVAGPLQKALALHYGGGSTYGTLVSATSQNGSGVTVSASPVAVSVVEPGASPAPGSSPAPGVSPTAVPTSVPTSLPTARPTPRPSPTQRPTQATSLYVADGQSDTISEYRIASQIAAGAIPNPAATPSRVIHFDPSVAHSSSIGGLGLSCSGANGTSSGNGTAGLAVDPSGTIFVFPNCTDGTNGFVFGYPANAVATAVPTIYDPFQPSFGAVDGLAIAGSSLYAAYTVNNEAIYGFSLSGNGRQPSVSTGVDCYAEFGNPSPGCFGYSYSGFGADTNGYLYVPAEWSDSATGDAAIFASPPTVLAVHASGNTPTVTPFAAIAGLNSTAGGSYVPVAATVDGSTLYVLTGYGILAPAATSTSQIGYYPGLSACPPPSANAPINAMVDPFNPAPTQCTDSQQHLYIAAYNISGQLLGPAANGTDVDLIPNFLIGGDTVGGFGCYPLYPGQFIAASGGYVYVINESPTCPGNNDVVAPEIDVYNTNGLSGAHTDIAPVFRLPLTTGYPLAVSIGPSGSVTGGQAWLRAPLGRAYRPNLYGRRRAQARPIRRTVLPHRP